MQDPIVLVQLGEPLASMRAQVGDFALWFQRALDWPLGLVDLRRRDEELPRAAAGYVIMGSPAGVYEDHPWMPRALDLARALLDGPRPALGVCFGHQLLARAAGGEVVVNPRGVEVGTIEVELTPAARDDALFRDLPARVRLNATHGDTVLRLPADDPPVVLGRSDRDAHQALRWRRHVWSVQFHPEMRARETRLAVAWRSAHLRAEGHDVEAVLGAVEEAPVGRTLLQRFADVVRETA